MHAQGSRERRKVFELQISMSHQALTIQPFMLATKCQISNPMLPAMMGSTC